MVGWKAWVHGWKGSEEPLVAMVTVLGDRPLLVVPQLSNGLGGGGGVRVALATAPEGGVGVMVAVFTMVALVTMDGFYVCQE